MKTGGGLREIVKIDPVMGQHQPAARTQRPRRGPRDLAHVARTQIMEQFRDHDDVMDRSRKPSRRTQAKRPGAWMVGEEVGDQARAGGRAFRCVETETATGDRHAVRAVTRAEFQHPADRRGPHCPQDRRALRSFVTVAEGPPGIGVRPKEQFEGAQADGFHGPSSLNSSTGRVKVASSVGEMEKPRGSSVMAPIWVR